MRDLMLWNRSALQRSVFDEMDKAFNEVFGKEFFPAGVTRGTYPKMNVYDSNGSLCIDAYVPEVEKDKLKIQIEGNILTLVGDSESDRKVEENNYYCRELSRKSFRRAIQLPDTVEINKSTADHKDGMLKIRIPYSKKEEKAPVNSIKIN